LDPKFEEKEGILKRVTVFVNGWGGGKQYILSSQFLLSTYKSGKINLNRIHRTQQHRHFMLQFLGMLSSLIFSVQWK
jgi:hypothetical protein